MTERENRESEPRVADVPAPTRLISQIAHAIEQGINDWSPENADCTMDEHAAKFVMTEVVVPLLAVCSVDRAAAEHALNEVVMPLLANGAVDKGEIIEVAPAPCDRPGTVPTT